MADITFAQNRQNYVGIPLEAVDDTMSTLELKYHTNKNAADEVEKALANIEVRPEDQHIVDGVGVEVSNFLDDVTVTGDWENATTHVNNAAKSVATNKALINALKSNKKRTEEVAALKERIGKPFQDGGITLEDYQREVARADAKYKGVYEEDGIWKGHWSSTSPPAYLDRGTYIDEFLDGWQANKLMGTLAKGEDGKWYRTKYTTTPDGSHHITEYTEEASDADLYAAARQHLTQNANIKERINYEVSNSPVSYDDYVAQGINRQSMTKELSDLGFSKNNLKSMSNEELAQTFNTEQVIYNSIKGAVDKHSFKKQTAQVLGKTWAQLQRETQLNNATKSGGDKNTVLVDRTISQNLTKGYDVTNIPSSIDDYQNNINLFDSEIIKHRSTIEGVQKQIDDNPDDKFLQAELMSAQTKLLEYERKGEEYDYWYKKAVKEVLGGKGEIPKNEIDQYFRDVESIEVMENSQPVRAVTQQLGSAATPSISKSGFLNTQFQTDRAPWQRYTEVDRLLERGAITQAERDAYFEYADKLESANTMFGKIKTKGDAMIDDINKSMERQASEKTVAYGYVDLSVDDFGKETAFTSRATQLLRNNYNNYRVIDTDGRAVEFNNLDQGDKYDPDNTKIIGVTTQYVGDHGYLLYAREDREDAAGTKMEPRFHLIKPTSMSGMLDSAIMEARKSNRVQNKRIQPGFNLSGPNELEQIWRSTDVDRQLAAFDNHPIISPIDKGSTDEYNKVVKPVNIGVKFDARVTRLVNNSGDVKWEVLVRDKESGQVANRTYGSRYSAEHALEKLAGKGYEVPLSSLVRMTKYSLENGQIDRNQVSTPYLHPEFYNAMQDFDAKVGVPYNIVSMTRSIEDNKKANGVEVSRHKIGRGVDISYNSTVADWLSKNSTEIPNTAYRKVMGTDLMYLIHDAGQGRHIHMEHTKLPEGVRRTSNANLALDEFLKNQ